MLKSKLEIPHAKDCRMFAAHKDDDPGYQFLWVPENTTSGIPIKILDAAGRKGRGWHHWLRLRCNDCNCPGIILVSLPSISEQLTTGRVG